MRSVIEKIGQLSKDDGYFGFQNSVAQLFYDCLGQGFQHNENEVALVKRLVQAADGQSYGPISLHAVFIHGPRSYVEFNYMDKPITKELGDMAIIGLITSGKQRLFQRISIIQNKKSSGPHWNIDLEQLFLLKNFPPLSGNKGILKGCQELSFRNTSGCLGTFGLMESPGEILLCSASILADCLGGRKSLSHSDLSIVTANVRRYDTTAWWSMPLLLSFPGFHPKEWFFVLEELFHLYGLPSAWFAGAGGHPFLGNVVMLNDIYDLVRSWTQFSLGEISYVRDTVINPSVDAFTNQLIRASGLEGLAVFPPDNKFGDVPFNMQFAVLVAHLDISEETPQI